MNRESEGVYEGIRSLIQARDYDLVLACDVGGDFIAAPENLEVLSPMMDAYALHVLRRLSEEPWAPSFVFAVFGLGTDGESTPGMTARALDNIGEYHVADFDGTVLQDVEQFYREISVLRRENSLATWPNGSSRTLFSRCGMVSTIWPWYILTTCVGKTAPISATPRSATSWSCLHGTSIPTCWQRYRA